MDVKIKTFRIQSQADEQVLNEFLAGKIVRHWGTSYEHADGSGIWNVMIAYEVRMNEPRQTGDRPRREQNGNHNNHTNNHQMKSRTPERPAREKAPREDYQPQIAEKDQPLFEAIRKWRNARAREERIKPFALFNNKQLEEIVNAKPATTDALRPLVPDMDASLWDRYQNELIGFLAAATHMGVGAPAEAEIA
jgi:superfamily II DNA helicase RecQ